MAARLALSSTSVIGQYIGTTKVTAPSAVPGSPTARRFSSGSRLVLGRSVDLGPSFMVVLSFWRASSAPAADNSTAQRLFTQYAIGGPRVAIGINRSFLSASYISASGALETVESKAKVLDQARHTAALVVTQSGFSVYLDGRLALQVEAQLAAADTAPVIVGADVAARAFDGTLDDLAIYQTTPGQTDNWLRYYDALIGDRFVRDYTACTWAAGHDGVTLSGSSFTATGSSSLARAAVTAAWSDEVALGTQLIELRFSAGSEEVRVGVMNSSHPHATKLPGESEGSYAWLSGGSLICNSAALAEGLPAWSDAEVVGLAWNPGTRELALWKDGEELHRVILPAGQWTPVVLMGHRTVDLNAGQSVPYAQMPLAAGLYSKVWSKLSTEFRHAKIGDVAATLDDAGSVMRDANSAAAVGDYLGTPLRVAGITGDPFDFARKVGGGVRLTAGTHTKAGQDFFFALAFSPEAEDLVGEKVLLESPGKWGIKLLDGRLSCWVGGVQVGSVNVAFTAGGRYLLGLARSGAGRLLVWCHAGYLMQSGDLTAVAEEVSEVWIGGREDGSGALAGSFSHLIASSKKPAGWKLNRLKRVCAWDTPEIQGLIPAPAAVRRVWEPSYQEVLALGLATAPSASECFVAVAAARPDEVAVGYRIASRTGGSVFAGLQVGSFAVSGTLTTALSRSSTLLTLSGADLAAVSAGGVAMVDNELCRIDSVNQAAGTVSVSRGCVDTVPVEHGVGARVWLYSGKAYGTQTSYTKGTAVDVKLLTQGELTELGEDMAPTDTLTVRGRQALPYPVADLRMNGMAEPVDLAGTVEVTWKVRNRILQGSSLVAWADPDAGTVPAGVTVVVRAYDADRAELLHESSEIPLGERAYDLHVEFTGRLTVTVTTYSGGSPCWQVPEVTFGYTDHVDVVLATEDYDAIAAEGGDLIRAERLTSLMAGSHSGNLPDDFTGFAEGDEVMATGDGTGSVIIGVRIGEMPQAPGQVTGSELIPVVRDGENLWVSPQQLYQYIVSTMPPPANGKDAYEIAVDLGFIGSRAQWLASLEGPAGPSSNASRRILTVSSASGAIACNWEQYDEIRLRLVGDVSLTFTGARDGQGCLLKIQQDGTGSRSVSLPMNVRFNALIPQYVPTQAAGMVDKVGFIYDSGESFYDLVSLVPGISSL